MVKYIITTLIALFCMVAFANAAPAKQFNRHTHKNETVQVCEFAKHKQIKKAKHSKAKFCKFAKHKQMKKFKHKRMHKKCFCKCQKHQRFHKGWKHRHQFRKGKR